MEQQKSTKEKIIDMLHRLPPDIDYDRAIEGIYVLQRVDAGLDDIRRGDVYEDEDVMAELLGDGQHVSTALDEASQG